MSGETSTASTSDGKTYEVHYKHWNTSITISDPSTEKHLYTLQKHDKIRVLTDASGNDLGTTKTHTFMTTRIDVSLTTTSGSKQTFEVKDDSKLNGHPTYVSPAFDGQQMTWKHNSQWASKIGWTLVDGKGLAVARFESNPTTQIGKLEILAIVRQKVQVDEIALVILTLLRRKLYNIQQATIAAVV